MADQNRNKGNIPRYQPTMDVRMLAKESDRAARGSASIKMCNFAWYLHDFVFERASGKWIKAASTQNDNAFEEPILALEQDDQLNDQDELSALSGADMNRIAPRYFLKCPRALAAVQKELAGLLKVHNGQAALELTSERDPRWRKNRRVHSMIVTKRKSTSEFKARLVLRGDTISEQDTAFASAPTACRGSVPMLLTWAVVFELAVYMVDISQAFLQADELAVAGKMITTVPPFVILPDVNAMPKCPESGMPLVNEKDIKVLSFDEYQRIPTEQKKSSFRRCLVTHRPLYGGRDAPLRWFLRLASALRKGGWGNTRSDVCTFTRHAKTSQGDAERLTSLIIVHVDDLLIASNAQDIDLLKVALKQFKLGPIYDLREERQMEYLGLELQQSVPGVIGMHQTRYIGDLKSISIEEVIKNQKWVISREMWKTLMKQIAGGLIWIGQTRFDSTAATTVLSTSMVSAASHTEKALAFLKSYNKALKMIQSNKDIIWLRSFWTGTTPTVSQLLETCSLFTFTDAGFGCLEGSFSTQGVVVAYGVAQKKETMVRANACLLRSQARKIHRVARSSLACEVLSISDGVDLSIWYQQYLFELLTGQFHCDTLSPSHTLPLLNPFLFGKTGTSLSGVDVEKTTVGTNKGEKSSASADCKLRNVMVVLNDEPTESVMCPNEVAGEYQTQIGGLVKSKSRYVTKRVGVDGEVILHRRRRSAAYCR